MIHGTINTKNIIAKVLSDLDIQEDNFRISDCREWAGEAVEKIGGFSVYNIKVTGKEDEPLLTVSNYQARLPSDVYRVLGIAYSYSGTGNYIPLRYGTGTFDYRQPINEDSTEVTDTAPESEVVNLAMILYGLDYEAALAYINANPTIEEELNALLVSYTNRPETGAVPSYTTDYTYVINNNYIKLNVSSGYLMVAYQALSVDTEGYPLIPNDPGYIEAVYWYIRVKLLYPEWAAGRITDRVYSHAEAKWRFYAKQAYANAIMPSPDMLESLKNKWLNLIPEINDFKTFFSTTGQEQMIFNAAR